jgi:hypothetical protein
MSVFTTTCGRADARVRPGSGTDLSSIKVSGDASPDGGVRGFIGNGRMEKK